MFGTTSVYLANAKIGKCQRYNEKDIFPINTKNLEDKILVITSSLLEKKIINIAPIKGTKVIIDGCNVFLLNKNTDNIIKQIPIFGER